MQLAKLEMSNQKYLTDIEQLNDRKKEIEAVLKVHLDEKVKLQKELVRNGTKRTLIKFKNL